MKVLKSLCLVGAVLLGASAANAGTITDGDFTDWTHQTFTQFTGVGGGTGSQQATGGIVDNGLSYLSTWDSVVGYVRNFDFHPGSSIDNLSGAAYTLEFDYKKGLDSGDYDTVGLAIKQGSNIWYEELSPQLFGTGTYQHFSDSSVFSTINFLLMDGSGSADFSGATPTQFGIFGQEQSVAGQYSMYYDNWSLTSTPLTALPEPGAIGALTLASLGLLKRRRKQNA